MMLHRRRFARRGGGWLSAERPASAAAGADGGSSGPLFFSLWLRQALLPRAALVQGVSSPPEETLFAQVTACAERLDEQLVGLEPQPGIERERRLLASCAELETLGSQLRQFSALNFHLVDQLGAHSCGAVPENSSLALQKQALADEQLRLADRIAQLLGHAVPAAPSLEFALLDVLPHVHWQLSARLLAPAEGASASMLDSAASLVSCHFAKETHLLVLCCVLSFLTSAC